MVVGGRDWRMVEEELCKIFGEPLVANIISEFNKLT